MNKLDVTTIILTVTLTIKVVANDQDINSRIETEKNMFHKVNIDLQVLINKIFSVIKLNETFARSYNNDVLIQMHEHLKRIIELNYNVLLEIKNISRAEEFVENSVFNLTKAVKDALDNENKMQADDKLKFKNKNEESNYTTDEINEELMSINLINNVLTIIDELDLNNTGIDEVFQGLGKARRMNNKRHNLKKWQSRTEPNNTRRVYQGDLADVEEFSFLASIHVLGTFTCAGSILSKDLIITAASCLQIAYNNRVALTSPASLTARAGSTYYTHGGVLLPITQVHFHPGYDNAYLKNNLALGRVPELGKTPGVRRIIYQKLVHVPTQKGDDLVTIVGWGDVDYQVSAESAQLAMAKLPFYNLQNCRKVYTANYVSDRNYCAGFITKGGGACTRDLGGPGIVRGVLTGVISFGPPACGTPDAPTVFTNIGHYAQWIDTIDKGTGIVDKEIGTIDKGTINFDKGTDTIDNKIDTIDKETGTFDKGTYTKILTTNAPTRHYKKLKARSNPQKMNKTYRKSQFPQAIELLKTILKKIIITSGSDGQPKIKNPKEVSNLLRSLLLPDIEANEMKEKGTLRIEVPNQIKEMVTPIYHRKKTIISHSQSHSKKHTKGPNTFQKNNPEPITKQYLKIYKEEDKLSTITDPKFLKQIQNLNAIIEPKYLKDMKQKILAASGKNNGLLHDGVEKNIKKQQEKLEAIQFVAEAEGKNDFEEENNNETFNDDDYEDSNKDTLEEKYEDNKETLGDNCNDNNEKLGNDSEDNNETLKSEEKSETKKYKYDDDKRGSVENGKQDFVTPCLDDCQDNNNEDKSDGKDSNNSGNDLRYKKDSKNGKNSESGIDIRYGISDQDLQSNSNMETDNTDMSELASEEPFSGQFSLSVEDKFGRNIKKHKKTRQFHEGVNINM